MAFVGGTGYAPGKVELSCNGEKLLSFDMAKAVGPAMGRERRGSSVISRRRHPQRDHDLWHQRHLRAGAPGLEGDRGASRSTLTVKTPAAGGGDWFMVHEYRSIQDEARQACARSPRCRRLPHSRRT